MARLRLHAVWSALALLSAASAAVAQVHPFGHHDLAERHRLETERLRARSDALADFAERRHQEARLRVLELEAARRPALEPDMVVRRPGSPEQEAARRIGVQERSRATAARTDQIDAWLDRGRPD